MSRISDAIGEVRRESMMRAAVYPRLIVSGKLTLQEAERRAQALAAALQFLEAEALRQADPRAVLNDAQAAAVQRRD